MLLHDFLERFFRSRGLEGPDGRNVYEYHPKAEEFEDLKGRLTEVLEGSCRSEMQSHYFPRALFLYSVMWVGLHHKEAHPSWSEVFDELPNNRAAGMFDWQNPVKRTQIIGDGLHYFGLSDRLQESGHQYIGLVFAQSGIPLRSLTEGSATISKRLLEAMTYLRHYDPDDRQMSLFLNAQQFPEGYDRETVGKALLTGSRVLSTIIDKYRQNGARDLANLYVEFCSFFPSCVPTTTQFEKLLNSFRKQLADDKPQELFVIERFLKIIGGEVRLRTAVGVPKKRECPCSALENKVGRFPKGTGSVFNISSGGKPFAQGRLTDDGRCRLSPLGKCVAKFDGLAALKAITLTLDFPRGADPWKAVLPDEAAAALSTDAVHFFIRNSSEKDKDKWFYRASGSLQTPASEAVVLVPEGVRVISSEDDAPEGLCAGSLPFAAYRLSSSCTFQDGEGECGFLQLKAVSEKTEHLALSGEIWGYSAAGTAIYRGIPKVVEFSSGRPQPIPGVLWKTPSGLAVQKASYTEKLRATVRLPGGRVKKFSAWVMPEEADTEKRPGRNRLAARLSFRNTGLAAMKTRQPEVMASACENVFSFEVATEDADRVRSLEAQCVSRSGAVLDLTVPFPATRCEFLLGEKVLERDQVITLSQAERLTARIFDSAGGNYAVEVRGINELEQKYWTEIPFNLSSDSETDELTFEEDFGEAVLRTMRLYGKRREVWVRIAPGSASVKITSFKAKIKTEESKDGSAVAARLDAPEGEMNAYGTLMTASPVFPKKGETAVDFPLDSPALPQQVLASRGVPWIISMKDDPEMAVRPGFFLNAEPNPLRKRFSFIEEIWSKRTAPFPPEVFEKAEGALQWLIKDPEDPDWAALEDFAKKAGVRALAALPIWDALRNNVPQAFMFAALLDAKLQLDSESVIREVARTQSWRWELIALPALCTALQAAANFLRRMIRVGGTCLDLSGSLKVLLNSRYLIEHPEFEPRLRMALFVAEVLDVQEIKVGSRIPYSGRPVKGTDELRVLWREAVAREAPDDVGRTSTESRKNRVVAMSISQAFGNYFEEQEPEAKEALLRAGVLQSQNFVANPLFGWLAWELAGQEGSVRKMKILAAGELYFFMETALSLAGDWSGTCAEMASRFAEYVKNAKQRAAERGSYGR